MHSLKLIVSLLSLSIFLFFAENTFAYNPERGNVQATLGPYIFKTNYAHLAHEENAPNMGGLALIATGDVNDKGALEVAVIYMNKLYLVSEGEKALIEKTQQLHISMGYRYWIGPYISASAGIFTGYPMGNIQTVRNDFTVNRPNTTARETTETGLDLAVQTEIWNRDRFSLIGEARYSLSLTKKANEAADQYGFSLGIRYFIQGSEKDAAKKAQ